MKNLHRGWRCFNGLLIIFCLLLPALPLAAASPADGSGQVRVVPTEIAPESELNVSFIITATISDPNIAEIELSFPPLWGFSGDTRDIGLTGAGFALARVHSIRGSGATWAPYILRIDGVAINRSQMGELRVSRLRAPAFAAHADNPANRFLFRSQGADGEFAALAVQPGIRTRLDEKPQLLITEFSLQDESDFVEFYCLDDRNSGAGNDLKGFFFTRMGATANDKNFASLIVHTGDRVLLRYHRSDSDDTMASAGLARVYTEAAGLDGGDGQLLLGEGAGVYQDAVPYANMDGLFTAWQAMSTLVNERLWTSVSELDCVSSSGMSAGMSLVRNAWNEDSNRRADFEMTRVPSPGAANLYAGLPWRVKISEVAPGYADGDYIELHVVDDGRGGLGLDLAGFELEADSGRFHKKLGTARVRSGDRILLSFDRNQADETESSGGLLRLYSSYRGLDPNEGAVELWGFNGQTADFMVYAKSDRLTDETIRRVNTAISSGQWQDSNPFYLVDFLDCVDVRELNEHRSIHRSPSSPDTDTRSDFAVTNTPTPGTANGVAASLHHLVIEDGGRIDLSRGVERKLLIHGYDVLGRTVRNADQYLEISSSSATAELSRDGMNWQVSLLTGRLHEGEMILFLRDASAGSFQLSVREKFDLVPRIQAEVRVHELPAVRINEIMYQASSLQTPHPEAARWVELKNGEDRVVDLSRYRFSDGTNTFVFPEGTRIPPLDYLVLCRFRERKYQNDPTSFADLYGDRDGRWEIEDGFNCLEFAGFDPGSSGTLRLSTPDGLGVSEVSWTSEMGAAGDGRSLERQRFDVESYGRVDIDRYNFVPSLDDKSFGTPGRVNSRDEAAPTAMVISHTGPTSHPVREDLFIHAEVTRAEKVELFLRDRGLTSYSIREMTRVDATDVWRAVVPAADLLSDAVEYYIRAWDGSRYVWHPSGGEAAPLTITLTDDRNRIYFETPVKVIGENEVFYVDVKARRVQSAIQNLELEIEYSKSFFTVEDEDSARPGIQIAVGSAFQGYFAEKNEVDADKGRIYLKLVHAGGSASGDLQLARIRFRSPAVMSDDDSRQTELRFLRSLYNGLDFDTALVGSLSLARSSSWVIGREGGTITASNGVKLTVPENALLVPVTIRVRKLTEAEIPATNLLDARNGVVSTRIAYELDPDGMQFRRPVRLSLPFTSSELSYSRITDSSNLKIYFWNRRTLAWERVGGEVRGDSVAVDIDHFTTYLLVEDRRVLAPAATEIVFRPNPFSPNGNGWNDVTHLHFNIANDADVTVGIYDVRGVRRRLLADRRRMFAGVNQLEWDGRDDFGEILRTGIYVFRFRALESDGSLVENQGTVVISRRMKDW